MVIFFFFYVVHTFEVKKKKKNRFYNHLVKGQCEARINQKGFFFLVAFFFPLVQAVCWFSIDKLEWQK